MHVVLVLITMLSTSSYVMALAGEARMHTRSKNTRMSRQLKVGPLG